MESKTSVLSRRSGILFVPDGRVLSLDHVVVGIVTALPQEYAVVCEILGCNQTVAAKREGGDKVYRLGVVREKAGQRGIGVAIALLNNMGNVTAATRVTNMINDCPRLQEIIVCGIAGAVPNPEKPDDHVRLGDIVVAGDVLEYDVGKQLPGGFQIKPRSYPASTRLIATARSLQSDELIGKRPWEKYIDSGLHTLGNQFARPPVSTDVLDDGNWNTPKGLVPKVFNHMRQWFGGSQSYHPDDSLRNQNPERPRIFHGLIASASSVLKNPETRERLRTEYSAIAVEMETAGAAHAAHTGNIPYFMVRGTCDYCNPIKNGRWQPYAALVAAAYTRALLEATDLSVFEGSQKVLVIIGPAPDNVELQDDVQAPLPEEYVRRALAETKTATVISGDLASVDIDAAPAQTSEAVREIPRLAPQAEESSSQAAPAGLRVSLQSDLVVTEPGRRSAPLIATGAEPISHTPEQQTRKDPDAQLSERERQLIESEGKRQLNNLKELFERWEYDSAFAAAVAVADWIVENERCISSSLASEIYEILARVEAVIVQRKAERGQRAELTRARYFLRKAKDARSR